MLAKKLGKLNEGGFDHCCILDFSQAHCFSTLFITVTWWNTIHTTWEIQSQEVAENKQVQVHIIVSRCWDVGKSLNSPGSFDLGQEDPNSRCETVAFREECLDGFKRRNSNGLLQLEPAPLSIHVFKKCSQIQRPHTNAITTTTTTTTSVLLSGGTSV